MTLIEDVFPKLRTLQEVIRQTSKNSRLRSNFDEQHGKRAQTFLHSGPQHL